MNNGYYWCDACEEPAFGPHGICHQCRRPARFIPEGAQSAAAPRTTSAPVPAQVLPTEREHPARRPAAITPEAAAQLFADLKHHPGLL
jgi:hypothetical protein